MDLFQGLLLISSIHILAAASPGPDFVLVSQQTLTNGRRSGFLCSLGIALGLSIHILYSSFGLAAIIANSAAALWVIKLLGGGYLIYLGIKGLRARPSVNSEPIAKTIERNSAAKTVGIGFLCNALNPKAPIYFVSLFTVVLSPDMPLYQIAIYGVWMMLIQLGWFSMVVILLSNPSVSRRFNAVGHWIDRVLGGAMVAIGLKVIATRTN
ncbi:LysE family translocator [Motiliproteus sp. MSK22-1]|uniref:LysE family translocator n=1 Tax=Motiliproteus sp. MSK22-1 TaxID=1897630 RepID=UPI0009765CE6|nr:LysE family transporter [Motiliproteus sp. MSK22-1]OMH33904.1 MFS transporter [Motiliproteus sp. MSK22-1]